MNGILYFHQGWTDIINCLALINYYCNKYEKIYVIMREDSKELVDFYTNNMKNVHIFYEEKQSIEYDAFNYIIHKYNHIDLKNCDFLAMGVHDYMRKDYFINSFRNNYRNGECFVKCFYESYNIPYIERINSFTVPRNYELEDITYNKFINKNGTEYILYHEVIEKYDTTKKIINLNQISNIYFDYIKVLENAIEIHLLDSSWAAVCYLLDAKYKLFQNKNIPIYLYGKRSFVQMFLEPIKLENWTIKE